MERKEYPEVMEIPPEPKILDLGKSTNEQLKEALVALNDATNALNNLVDVIGDKIDEGK